MTHNPYTYTLTSFWVDRKVEDLGLTKACRLLFERSGFEIVFGKENDTLGGLRDRLGIEVQKGDWFVCLDLVPWKDVRSKVKNVSWDSESENHRIEWSLDVVSRFLADELNQGTREQIISGDFFRGLLTPCAGTATLKSFFAKFYPAVLKENDRKAEEFECRFPVVKELTDYGCNNRIDLVECGGQKLICKTFKPTKLRYLENEVIARNRFAGLLRMPKIVERTGNYILLEYLQDIQPIHVLCNRNGLLRIEYAKLIFSAFNRMFEAGFVHLDFHPGNVLVEGQVRLVFLDFEYLQKYTPTSEVFRCPGVVKHDKLVYDSPLEDITYQEYWLHLIRLPLSTLLRAPLLYLRVRRLLTLLVLEWRRYKVKLSHRMGKSRRLSQEVLSGDDSSSHCSVG